MATGKYTRIDGRKVSSGYCSSVTILVFVALCMVGVWMMTSSSVVPGRNADVSQENKNEVSEINAENKNDGNKEENNINPEDKPPLGWGQQKPFEDNQGDLPTDEAFKLDNNINPKQEDKNEKSVEGSNPEEKIEQLTEGGSNPEEKIEQPTEGGSNPEEKIEQPAEGTNPEEKNEKPAEAEPNPEDKQEPKPENGVKDAGPENNEGGLNDENGEQKKVEPQPRVENNADETNKVSEENSGKLEGQVEEKKDGKPDQGSTGNKDKPGELLPSGAQSELLKESTTQAGSFPTQATESNRAKDGQNTSPLEGQNKYSWKLCNTSAGQDYIPCLDNIEAISHLRSTKHYEHRERHCPENPPTCLVPVPQGYKKCIEWPTSREKIWYHNVPHTKLVEIKGHQNWVKVSGEFLTFPGGGTQFKHGALHYIDFIQQSVPDIAWGKRSRVVLDVGCGVASFGGFLFDRDALTMSLAPKDEHEAQIQFALERGIPAISAVMGTKRLPYPGKVYDVVHCARCRVPWHIEGGKLLLELNRLLRPGGFFVWSATPIYQKLQEDVEIWQAMKQLTKAMCWELVSITKDRLNKVGIAIYRKPTTNECYEQRQKNEPPLCQDSDDPNAAWNVPLQACMHKIPAGQSERGSQWPEEWPARAAKAPYWLSSTETGVYGKPAPQDFKEDYEHWQRVVNNSYLNGLGINWSTVRNAMDMRAVYGGLAAALKDLNIWVMNIVSIDAPDTLPIIFERGLFGMYHDWCESFSTYPRSYDLLHADHLFSKIKKKCNFMALVAEADRILRPEGKIIVRDKVEVITELEEIFRSMQWDIRMTYARDKEGLLYAQKTMWRPKEEETLTYAIGESRG